ncbi:MAG: hypothetical protein QM811_21090 [Pirellulales bacterium]
MGSYDVSDESPERRFRTLFISDVHLGARGSQADLLLDFLRYHDADTIYLVGDIVDGWALKSSWYWPQSHNDVVQKLLRKARKGSQSSICRAITTSSCATITARISAASRWSRTSSTKAWTAGAISSSMATSSTSWCRTRAGSPIFGDHAYNFAIQMNTLRQHVPPSARRAILVAVAMGEAQGQERRQLHRRVRAGARRRGAPA